MEEEKIMTKKQLQNKSLSEYILDVLWFIALVLGSSIAVYLLIELSRNDNFIKDNGNLLSALFILLSASIASASIMKSIASSRELQENSILANKKLKDLDISREDQTNLLFMLHICKDTLTIYNRLNDEKCKKNHIYNRKDLNKIYTEVEASIESWDKIYNDKYFILFNENDSETIYTINHDIKELKSIILEKIYAQDFTINPNVDKNTLSFKLRHTLNAMEGGTFTSMDTKTLQKYTDQLITNLTSLYMLLELKK